MNPTTPVLPVAFFRLAFRPFFLLGALFSVCAVALWVGHLNGWWQPALYGGSVYWHGHEMLFGFVCAIVVGFLLTAVQNWTGIAGLQGKPLGALALLWGAGRLAMLTDAMPLVSAVLDSAFLPVAAVCLARPILRVKQYRNLLFIPLLLLLGGANIVSHVGTALGDPFLANQGLVATAWIILLIMTVMGGRVVPMFTANGSQTARVNNLPMLEKSVIGGTLLLALLHASGWVRALPDSFNAALLLGVGLLHAWRIVRWRFWVTGRVPLLWSLHIAFGFIPLSLCLLALHYAAQVYPIPYLSYSTALHLMLVGAMGNMILSMTARVALGHSGRPLQPVKAMSFAFVAIALAALGRTLLLWWLPAASVLLINGAAAFWLIAYGLFTVCYWPVLTQARVDGKPG